MKKNAIPVVVLALTALCMSACHRQPQSKPQSKDLAKTETVAKEGAPEFKTLEDRYSYAYGASLAETFKVEGVKFNVALMAAAMQAEFDGRQNTMSKGEIAATIEAYRAVHEKEQAAALAVAAPKNKKEGEAFLKDNAKKEGVIVTKSGLQYKVITKGRGGYKPTAEDEVKIQYRARLLNGTEFDSTYFRNEPYVTAPQALIEGCSQALQLMSEGAKWELYIPANLAYGEEGSPPVIGPNAVLIFEMELLEIKKYKAPT
jgi:FKBP-type peptidyl-prolyl cis-trans isomerase